MGLENAKISIAYSDLQELQNGKNRIEKELADAKDQIDQLRLGPEGDDKRELSDALNNAIVVLQFAVAHLDPLTVRGWPFAELRALATGMEKVPALRSNVSEISASLRLFADNCEYWEKHRAAGTEQQALADSNAARGAAMPGGA